MPARIPKLSEAVLSARARRATDLRRKARATEIEWFIKEVSDTVRISMRRRIRIATALVQDRVVRNIGRPVTKEQRTRKRDTKRGKAGSSYTHVVPSSRSKPGEYPKADTVQLQKSIFSGVREVGKGNWEGFVGTPLHYGFILETKMNRKFLTRTLNELRPQIHKLLGGPITGRGKK